MTPSPTGALGGRAEDVARAVAAVTDPEYPDVTIAELGMLERVVLIENDAELGAPAPLRVRVELVPTVLGCPALRMIEADVRSAALEAGAATVEVAFLLHPVWSPDRIAPSARQRLAKEYTITLRGRDGSLRCPLCGSAGSVRTIRHRPSTLSCGVLLRRLSQSGRGPAPVSTPANASAVSGAIPDAVGPGSTIPVPVPVPGTTARLDGAAAAPTNTTANAQRNGRGVIRSTDASGERGARRRNRNDVVHAAGRLFAERGFHGTSMRDLGEAMGLLGSSLYAHIGSKNELLVEVIASGADQFAALAEAVLASGDAPAERLRRLVAGHVQILTDNADHAATLLNEARHLEPEQRARVLAWRDRYESAYRTTLADGVAAGTFRPDLDPARTATFVLSLLNGVHRWYRPDGTDTPDTLAAQLHQFIERAVAAPEVTDAHL